jgi:hypothetical protein
MSAMNPLPTLYTHCEEVYKAMAGEAKRQPLPSSSEEGAALEFGMVWEGYTTKLFQRLRLAVPYFSSVTKALKAMGCIQQLRRGGGGSPSQWLVIQAPTEELWNANDLTEKSKQARNGGDKKQAITQREKDLNERVTELERLVAELRDVFFALYNETQGIADEAEPAPPTTAPQGEEVAS